GVAICPAPTIKRVPYKLNMHQLSTDLRSPKIIPGLATTGMCWQICLLRRGTTLFQIPRISQQTPKHQQRRDPTFVGHCRLENRNEPTYLVLCPSPLAAQ